MRAFSRNEPKAHERGYRVTVDGTVTNPAGRAIKTQVNNGRLWFRAGRGCIVRVHRLAAFQKFGDAIYAPGIEVRHLDGNALNNSPDNLALGTRSENEMDKPEEVRRRSAAKATAAIRKHDHAAILEHYASHGLRLTANHFNVRPSQVHYVVNQSITARNSVAAKH